MDLSYFLYPGDSSLTDTKTILGLILNAGVLQQAIFETMRGLLHLLRPYESHTDVSKLATVNNITGVSLDALAMLTYQYGFASMVSIAGYLTPFFFGDANRHISVYIIAVTSLLRIIQMFNVQ